MVDKTNYGKLIIAPAVAFGVLYIAATFGQGWAWPLALLVALSVFVVRAQRGSSGSIVGALTSRLK